MTFKSGTRDVGEVTETKVLSLQDFRRGIHNAVSDAGIDVQKIGFGKRDQVSQPGGLLIQIDESGELSNAYLAQDPRDRRTPLPRVVPTTRQVTIIVPVGQSLTTAQKTLLETRINAIGGSVTFARS
jgi:hypothetical protein